MTHAVFRHSLRVLLELSTHSGERKKGTINYKI